VSAGEANPPGGDEARPPGGTAGASRAYSGAMTSPLPLPDTVDAVVALLAKEQYVCDRRLATALFLALKLGRPLFLEVWGDENPEVFAILDDGSVVEMFFVRRRDLSTAEVGAITPLLDREGVLAGLELPVRPVARGDLVAATRDVLAWFWHDADHLLTALARGQEWWAYGQVEALRGHCVNVVRLGAGRPSEPEPYWKLEAALSTEPLEDVRRTIVPIELPALSRAGRDLVTFFGRHGREAAETYNLDYPTELERLIASRLDELIAQLDAQRHTDPH